MGKYLLFTCSFAGLVWLADVEDKIICSLDNFKIGELFVAYHMALVWELLKLKGLAQKPVSSAALQSEGYFLEGFLFFEKKRETFDLLQLAVKYHKKKYLWDTVHSCKMYNSVIFSTVRVVQLLLPQSVLENIYHLPHAALSSSFPPQPSPRQPSVCFLSQWIYLFWIFHVSGSGVFEVHFNLKEPVWYSNVQEF